MSAATYEQFSVQARQARVARKPDRSPLTDPPNRRTTRAGFPTARQLAGIRCADVAPAKIRLRPAKFRIARGRARATGASKSLSERSPTYPLGAVFFLARDGRIAEELPPQSVDIA